MSSVLKKYFKLRPNEREALECPACGKEDKLWAGISSSTESGVGCTRCRLAVRRWWPKTWPKTMPKDLDAETKFTWMYCHCLLYCLRIWNRMPRKVNGQTKT